MRFRSWECFILKKEKIFLDKICDQLIERANYYGGKDNIGVVVIEQTLNEG